METLPGTLRRVFTSVDNQREGMCGGLATCVRNLVSWLFSWVPRYPFASFASGSTAAAPPSPATSSPSPAVNGWSKMRDQGLEREGSFYFEGLGVGGVGGRGLGPPLHLHQPRRRPLLL